MKSLKFTLPVALLMMMAYTSCRKSENSPAPVRATAPVVASTSASDSVNDAAASQIAVNLANSLGGAYGGANANMSVDSVSFDNYNHNGPQHGKPTNSLCGFFTDSVVNYITHTNDLKSHTGGDLTFYFNCKNGRPDGYKAYDSLNTIGVTKTYAFQYMVKQTYTIECLDNSHFFNGVNGDIYAFTAIKSFSKSVTSYIANGNYVLKNLVVDLRDHDVISGTATFQSYGTNKYGNWSFTGSMTFLGHHEAKLVMNGKFYTVNVITGQITSH